MRTACRLEAGTTSAPEPLFDDGRPGHPAADACIADLFDRHGPMVLGLCRMLLRNRDDAEDATQQTFLSAYRSMLAGARPRSPGAWLARIARNECLAQIHRRQRAASDKRLTPVEPPDPVVATIESADLADLWRAIGDLPGQQREALVLREFSGLSYSELANELAVSEPAVESLLFRARRQLRLRLRGAEGPSALAPLALARAAADWLSSLSATSVAAGAAAVVVVGGGAVVGVHHALVVRHALVLHDANAAEAVALAPVRAAKRVQAHAPTVGSGTRVPRSAPVDSVRRFSAPSPVVVARHAARQSDKGATTWLTATRSLPRGGTEPAGGAGAAMPSPGGPPSVSPPPAGRSDPSPGAADPTTPEAGGGDPGPSTEPTDGGTSAPAPSGGDDSSGSSGDGSSPPAASDGSSEPSGTVEMGGGGTDSPGEPLSGGNTTQPSGDDSG